MVYCSLVRELIEVIVLEMILEMVCICSWKLLSVIIVFINCMELLVWVVCFSSLEMYCWFCLIFVVRCVVWLMMVEFREVLLVLICVGLLFRWCVRVVWKLLLLVVLMGCKFSIMLLFLFSVLKE